MTTQTAVELSVVFSFRNEAPVLPELIRRTMAVLEALGLSYEIIFVDDASTDGSFELLCAAREQNPRIGILRMSRRFGVHPCVLAGLRHARGAAVIYMDADLQDPPELIPELVARWRAGAEVVNTVRLSRAGEPPLKMWLTGMAYRVLNLLSDTPVPYNVGEYKLLDRRVVNELIRLDEIDPFFRGLVQWVGFRQETVPYHREARFAGRTHFALLGGGPVKEFLRGLLSFSAAPLYLALGLGFLSSAAALVYAGYVIVKKWLGLNLPGWSALMVAILFIGGMILLTNGLIGLYLARVYEQVKNRPRYIIRERVGIPPATGSGLNY
ncbi:MAG: glycosyltransferase family 2 protein [bacterium]|nr:glycosyltransferase family 2 protein [bacterium]